METASLFPGVSVSDFAVALGPFSGEIRFTRYEIRTNRLLDLIVETRLVAPWVGHGVAVSS